ncbi:serine/threonine-protein phosphatase [Paenibacillus doosanensis]|uniref:Serine/threonine phosphatase stp n=1 Tax=Paenibacillus konkukensis TaxID=2020716 RepID=A0ABY4RHH8_9BACL|nr:MULTISPECIES: PP2C family serine/threonine-protein phosphatase [Paenibacillus]MCS7461121.1 serine/threonine-protein phosphatase [Paenibacillus doosanensis]UQZ81617.1 Serine/threonine phosphatase stp [Paenibacillus konkukensis]
MKTTFAVNWHYGAATHPGWFRMINEDRSLLRIGTTSRGEPYAVAAIADGVGGSGDGSKASETALNQVRHWLDGQLHPLFREADFWLRLNPEVSRLFRAINEELIRLGNDAGCQISTTLTLLFLLNETFFIFHIGDCRVYHFNRGHLRQMTKDQSWISEQVRRGRLSKQQARRHPRRNMLLQCLGAHKELQLIRRTGFYTPGSLFVLCSDGFYNRITDSVMERLLIEHDKANTDVQQLSDVLVDRALDNRSNDNISVLLLKPLNPSFTGWRRACHRMKNIRMLFPVEWRK